MKTIIWSGVLAMFVSLGAASQLRAGVLDDTLDVEAAVSVGGPLGLAFVNLRVPANSTPFSARIAGRIGVPRYSPIELEVSLVPPFGMGCNLIINAFEMGPVQVHLLDPGIFWIWWKPLNAADLPRRFDLSVGAGVDIALGNGWSLLLDWRVHTPERSGTYQKYAGFAIPAYEEAAAGGQTWIGMSYTW